MMNCVGLDLTFAVQSEANPQVYVETPLHPEKLTVWCALWAGGIIGPYFFKNDEGYNVTVNGDRYRAMITNFFIPELNNHDVQKLWFQQDGATCHTARATIDLLKDTFVDRLISRFGPVNWPPRSCDSTPLDYFLWGYVKHWSMRISHKCLTIWKTTFAVLLPIYGHKCWKKSSKIGRPDWTTSESAVASDQEDHEERGSQDRAASICGPLSDSLNDTSRRRLSNCSTNDFQNLAEENIKSKRPFRAHPLTQEHRQLRLQWCQARSKWNVTDWQKVLFSDVSLFVLGTDVNRVRLWRRPGERYIPPHTVLRHTARTAGVMVWAAKAYNNRYTLIVMRGTLTSQGYFDDVLRLHVGSFLNDLPGAIFQQNNARLHTARVAQDFLRHFQTLRWPYRSPDMSPVVHVWDQLKRQRCHRVTLYISVSQSVQRIDLKIFLKKK
ncbi:transposable element Tcb2 transposase [Trichonephila clavipes]|nr:transposable element Tcb2 transposase [Trichonephila clavipes]